MSHPTYPMPTLHKSATFTVGYRLSMVGVIGTEPWPFMREQVILLENTQSKLPVKHAESN
jgi:hypothetical protein